MAARRMTTPLAAGMRQAAHARPAMSADDAFFPGGNEAVACDAAYGKKQFFRCVERAGEFIAQRALRQLLPVALANTFHITSRSGSMSNQRLNDAAPWCRSIRRPSAAVWPAALASRTSGVSPAM